MKKTFSTKKVREKITITFLITTYIVSFMENSKRSSFPLSYTPKDNQCITTPEDITEEVRKLTKEIENFPSQIRVLESKRCIGETKLGLNTVFILIVYEEDGTKKEYWDLECCTTSNTLKYMLSEITKRYKRKQRI